MYIPASFVMSPEDARALIAAHPFAWLEVVGGDVAAIPMLARAGEPLVLEGHVAAASPIGSAIREGGAARVLFTGPHAYVSPRWYRSPAQVPTWSYVAVVASGVVRAEALDGTLRILDALARRFEPEDGWTMASLDADHVAGLARGVVGFTIEVAQLESKAKLSQNRAPKDREGAIEGLRASGEADVAELTARVFRGEPVFRR
jgi:transcriptional regulator